MLPQHIKTWLELNSLYICRTAHILHPWEQYYYSQITSMSETQYITEKEKINCERSQAEEFNPSVYEHTLGTGDKDVFE